jgi:tetratricopeptide (TPR) repeat protein
MKVMYHFFISFWKEPFQASREVLIDTSQEALMRGQVEFAMSSAFSSCRMSFICGQNLLKGELNCTSLAQRVAQLRQIQSSLSLATHHSMILKLMNVQDTTRPFAMLHGDIHNEDDLLEFCLKTEKFGIVNAIHSNRLFIAYFFRRFDEAVSMAEKYRSRKMLRFLDVYVEFFGALSALQLARRHDQHESKWIETAERSITMFDTWVKHNIWNHENKRLLLLAEMHRTRGQLESAEDMYKASIASAQNHLFDHEAGIAHELLGEFYKEQGKILDAKEQFVAACDCYERWGATALVNQLKERVG